MNGNEQRNVVDKVDKQVASFFNHWAALLYKSFLKIDQ